MSRPFLLSPAHCGGVRARILLEGRGAFPLAQRLRREGASIGDVFTFLSGLYFRGKLAYARAFGTALVIVPGRGLLDPDTIVTPKELRAIARIRVDLDEPRFRRPLQRAAETLASTLPPEQVVVLLGSIATGKYVDAIDERLGGRLRFPAEFVGRGDMSRGGLMLRCVLHKEELDYVPLEGSVRHGKRPPRLAPLR
ncbi:MAG TPA: hypothetical protein VJ826_08575 [Candidatus Polarisedimenticolaceae bacterium]|nr:hypothetical protein [Candidatus Polarisedimenticolaceae bacterium]